HGHEGRAGCSEGFLVFCLDNGVHFRGYPSYLADVNGTLFFATRDTIRGSELWTSDGTTTGTVVVTDFGPANNSSIFYLTAVKSPTWTQGSIGTQKSATRTVPAAVPLLCQRAGPWLSRFTKKRWPWKLVR